MSVNRPVRPDDRLVRYLLGELSEDEAERMDEQSIADDAMAERLRLAEDELIDGYVAGTLSADLRDRVETFYLATPRRRERLAFATRFLAAVDRQPEPKPRVPIAPVAAARSARAGMLWPLATAAALVLACGGLLLQNAQLHRGLDEARRQGDTVRQRATTLAGELAAQQTTNAALAHQLSQARSATSVAQTLSAAAALVLLPQTRGVTAVPIVAVRQGAGVVPFYLRVEDALRTEDVAAVRYDVALRDPATNQIVWRAPVPPASASASVVSVAIPSAILKPQHYSLELSASRPPGAARALIASYAFEVAAR